MKQPTIRKIVILPAPFYERLTTLGEHNFNADVNRLIAEDLSRKGA